MRTYFLLGGPRGPRRVSAPPRVAPTLLVGPWPDPFDPSRRLGPRRPQPPTPSAAPAAARGLAGWPTLDPIPTVSGRDRVPTPDPVQPSPPPTVSAAGAAALVVTLSAGAVRPTGSHPSGQTPTVAGQLDQQRQRRAAGLQPGDCPLAQLTVAAQGSILQNLG